MLLKFALFFGIYTSHLSISESAKILGIFSAPTQSHLVIHDALMVKLAQLGHDVTVVHSFKSSKELPKTYRHIYIPFEDNRHEEFAKNLTSMAEINQNSFSLMANFFSYLFDRHQYVMNHPLVENLKQHESFDLLVLGWFVNDFQIGLAAHFNCPIVISSTIPPSVLTRNYVGNPSGVAFNPSGFLNHKGPMNFWKRVQNFFANSIEFVVLEGVDYFFYEPLYTKNFPPEKYPSFEEAKKSISLVLVNNHFSQGSIEAYLPAMLDVGGIQLKESPSPLPKDIQEWIDGATDGVIYFSLGSNAKSSYLSPETRDVILKVFSTLKQRVIWKYEANDLANKPNNVMIGKWLPQTDILAHPNVKVFISHCGFGGVTEAKYRGVPILGLPIYGDQHANLERLVSEGWGVQLSLSELTEETFSNGLREILHNPSYGEVVRNISQLYRDRPMSPLELATFWVQYVIRHKGAKHMQSPAVHLNILQYYSVDVIGFLLLVLYISWKLTKLTFSFLFTKCKSKLKSKKD